MSRLRFLSYQIFFSLSSNFKNLIANLPGQKQAAFNDMFNPIVPKTNRRERKRGKRREKKSGNSPDRNGKMDT